MNYSTAVMLFNKEIRAINVTYEPDTDRNLQPRTMFKTVDKSIKKGDFVAIPTNTRHNITVVKVEDVDVEVDFDSSVEVKWIVGKVDTETSAKITEDETVWIAQLKASEKHRKAEEMKKNVIAMYEYEGGNKMPLPNIGGTLSIEHKKE